MATAVQVPRSTDTRRLDEVVARLNGGAKSWANTSVDERIRVAQMMMDGIVRIAERQVAAACAVKDLKPGSPQEGEEWIGGLVPTVRVLRLTIQALQQIKASGTTRVGPISRTVDGRLSVHLSPLNAMDRVLVGALTAEAHILEGIDEAAFERDRASAYKKKNAEGAVSLVLGAGNVNSIPPMDVITKMFNEGKVCVLKMNPVNAYVGPLLEEAWADLIKRDWLAVVYGGADEGGYLCHHAGIHEVHITGSDKTHDMIVWGPPGPEREDRKRRNDPLLKKEISSELGTVSPVLVVPGPWDSKSLSFQAENLAGMVTNNASFNCNAAKLLVTPKGWDRTEFLFERIMTATGAVPTRKAWYPGARQRYDALTAKRAGLRTVGATGADLLPWTLIPGLNPDDVGELAFTMEPFCSILSATEIGDAKDPVDFLERAVEFSNKRVWGTLSATMVVHPKSMKDPAVRDAVERAVTRLKYGAVGINTWPAWAYALGDTPWGAHPSSTLDNIQGGKGWVHNAHMIEHTEKVVIRAPVSAFPKPPYFPTHRTAHGLGRALMEFEAKGWSKLPAVAIAGMRG